MFKESVGLEIEGCQETAHTPSSMVGGAMTHHRLGALLGKTLAVAGLQVERTKLVDADPPAFCRAMKVEPPNSPVFCREFWIGRLLPRFGVSPTDAESL